MKTPSVIVESIARGATPSKAQLSGFLLSSYRIIHRVHCLWVWGHRIETHANPENFLKLAAGRVVNWLAGDTLPVRVAAQAVLITKYILETVDEQVAMKEEVESLWDRLSDPYALPPKVKWTKTAGGTFLSPSTKHWWKIKFNALVTMVSRIFKAIFSLFKGLFKLSMKMLDTLSAFSFTTSTKNAAVNEIFVNFSRMMKLLNDERELLLCCLQNNKKIIKQLLEGTQSAFTYEQLFASVKETIKVSRSFDRNTKNVSETVRVISKDIFQRASFGLFQMVGMTHLLPNSWVFSRDIPWLEGNAKEKNYERFPEFECVRLS